MPQEYGGKYVITEATGAVQLVSSIEGLRKEIDTNCAGISQKARRLSMTNRKVALRLESWETELSQIRKTTRNTHSLDQLNELKNRCEKILDDLARTSKM